MPKRPNPFGDPFATQFKTRVSQKDVDLGVDKEKNMKAVYEKTLALLYGAQRNLAQTNEHGMNGHGMNGHGMNGHGMNGHGMNGHGIIGREMNGHGMNGHGAIHPANEHIVNGITPSNGQCNGMQHHMANGHSHHGATNGGMDVDTMATDGPELVSGQSFLDSNCRLVNSLPESAVQSRNLSGAVSCHNNNIQAPLVCQMCRRNSRPAKSHCNFCEKFLCADCIRQCDNCEDKFCILCSTVNYDERYERVFCLSCTA